MIIPRSEVLSFRISIIAFLMDGVRMARDSAKVKSSRMSRGTGSSCACNRLLPGTEGAVAHFRGLRVPLASTQPFTRQVDRSARRRVGTVLPAIAGSRSSQPPERSRFRRFRHAPRRNASPSASYTAQARALRREKWLEGTGNGLRGHSDTSIDDAELDKAARL
jgi:hypothetical protein